MITLPTPHTLGILYRDHDGLGLDQPFTDAHTLKAYTIFSERALRKGLRVVLGGPLDYSEGNFTRCWDLVTNTITTDVHFDICWDRNIDREPTDYPTSQTLLENIASRMPVANHPSLSALSEDKLATFQKFPAFVPKTYPAHQLEELRQTLAGKVVTKPRFGSHGTNVSISPMHEVITLPDDFIIQPFVDSSSGIPGVIESVHDLRVTVLNGEIVDTYVRYPIKGLISNISRGGKMKTIHSDALPSPVIDIIHGIDSTFSLLPPRFYSIDFMIDRESRPWVIEMNKAPGIWGHIATGIDPTYFESLCDKIIDAFIASLARRG